VSNTAINTFSNVGLQPAYAPELAVTKQFRLKASTTYAAGQVLEEIIGTNALQKLVISGVPTGGTFTLTFGAQTTAGIAFGASNEVIRAAIEALSSVGAGNVKVTGGWNDTGGIWNIEWRGALGQAAQSTLTCAVTSLTGGSAAQATSSVTAGAAGTPGTMGPYASTDSSPQGVARGILKYACTTDASNNITGPGGYWGETVLTASVYVSGFFNSADLTGLTDQNIGDFGSIVSGSLASATGAVVKLH
jgi:hypothetical protein